MNLFEQQAKMMADVFDRLAVPKRKSIFQEDFSVFIGDAEFCVQGDYDRDDQSVGYRGGYTVNRVWVASDIDQTDISDYLSKPVTESLEESGAVIMAKREREAKADHEEALGRYR